MKVELETICNQLAEAIGLPCGTNVAALIDEKNGDELKGWCVVRVHPDGQTSPINSERYATIKELMSLKKTYDDLMMQAIKQAEL